MPRDQQFSTPSIRIGCSGWQYKHWRASFYPTSLPQSRWLEYYARQFDTVEINNTFYRLPETPTFAAWRRRVPRGFVSAVKASRYLTHMKKLKDPKEPLSRFFMRAKGLKRALGPVLYQLPPHWKIDLERLDAFLKALPRTRRHAIEFRDPSWYSDEVFTRLERHKVALCLHDMAGSATGKLPVGPFVYVRFHGAQKYSRPVMPAAFARRSRLALGRTARETIHVLLDPGRRLNWRGWSTGSGRRYGNSTAHRD